MSYLQPHGALERQASWIIRMLTERLVEFDDQVPVCVADRLGRPVPYFLQMITQNLYRLWKRSRHRLVADDVRSCFEDLIISSGARDKLQHFYSRIQQYYDDPKRSAAYELLAQLSVSDMGLPRSTLFQVFEEVLNLKGMELPQYERKQLFNQLLRDLENDFYISELTPNTSECIRYDFASGLLKSWWKKYYA
jgi:hypothetical protein